MYIQRSDRRGGVHIHTHNTPIVHEGYIYIHTTLLQKRRGTYTYTQYSYRRGGVHIHTHNTPTVYKGHIMCK